MIQRQMEELQHKLKGIKEKEEAEKKKKAEEMRRQ